MFKFVIKLFMNGYLYFIKIGGCIFNTLGRHPVAKSGSIEKFFVDTVLGLLLADFNYLR